MDCFPYNLKSHFRERMAKLESGMDEFFTELLIDVQRNFGPIIRQLMDEDPVKRLSVQDVMASMESFRLAEPGCTLSKAA
jgi:hypothetical protein